MKLIGLGLTSIDPFHTEWDNLISRDATIFDTEKIEWKQRQEQVTEGKWRSTPEMWKDMPFQGWQNIFNNLEFGKVTTVFYKRNQRWKG